MKHLLLWSGRLFGLVGAVVTLLAIASRLSGQWHMGPLSIGAALQGGVASMVIGCLAYVAVMAERDR